MTEQQADHLIDVIGELANAVDSIGGKGQHGYTIADSLEELALQYWYKQEKTAPRVKAQIDAITKEDDEAISQGWGNIPLTKTK